MTAAALLCTFPLVIYTTRPRTSYKRRENAKINAKGNVKGDEEENLSGLCQRSRAMSPIGAAARRSMTHVICTCADLVVRRRVTRAL